MGALSIWKRNNDVGSTVLKRHEQLAGINATVSEYSELLEQVSTERAHLLKTISELQLKNAELAVGKALYADLELELQEMRKVSQQAVEAIDSNRKLKKQLDDTVCWKNELSQEAAALRVENGVLKGRITRRQNKEERTQA